MKKRKSQQKNRRWTKERIHELEDRIEIIWFGQLRENRFEAGGMNRAPVIHGIILKDQILLYQSPKRGRERGWGWKLPKFVKKHKLWLQEGEQIPNMINLKTCTPSVIVVKILETKDQKKKKKVLENGRRKRTLYLQVKPFQSQQTPH